MRSNTYPIVLLPPDLRAAQSAYPPSPAFREPPPPAPRDIPKRDPTIPTLLGAALGVGFITDYFMHLFPYSLILSAGIILSTLIIVSIPYFTYPGRKRKYDRDLVEYSHTLNLYNQLKRQHDQRVQISLTPQRIDGYRQEQVRQSLKTTCSHDHLNLDAQRGASEQQFLMVDPVVGTKMGLS